MTIKRNRLPEIAAELDNQLDEMVEDLVEAVANGARLRVPFGEHAPHLRDAIHVERNSQGSWSVVAGDSDVFYGHLVEFGHKGPDGSQVAPQPFLIPALEMQRAKVAELARLALKDL